MVVTGLMLCILCTFPAASADKVRAPKAYLDLVSLLEGKTKTGKKPESLEDLLPLLSEELVSNFTFIYQSRSPHGGLGTEVENAVDPLHPRTVLFTRDGKLTVAFNGNPEKPGYNILEVIYFDDSNARFHLTHFALPKASPNSIKNGERDPEQCLRCHGADPRPITDSYPLWPGFYGSVRDTFPKGSPELPWYRKFLKEESGKGPYRFLKMPKGTSVPPYLDPKDYDKNLVEAPVHEMALLPNTRLGMAWTELNRKRIQRKLMASPLYAKYKYNALSDLLGCELRSPKEGSYDAVYQRLYQENQDRLIRIGYHPEGPAKNGLDMMELGLYENIYDIERMAETLSVDSSDWSLAFEGQSLSYFDGILSSVVGEKNFYLKEDFIQEILKDIARVDVEFRPYLGTYSIYQDEGYPFGERLDLERALGSCEVLKRKTVKRIDLAYAVAPPSMKELPSKPASALLQRCTQCHAGIVSLLVGRKIPLEDPESLANVLTSKAKSGISIHEEIAKRISMHGPGQMPPFGERLSPQERDTLLGYLGQFGGR